MKDAEILTMKLNLSDCALDDKGKEDFLAKIDNFEVHLKLRDETPFFVRPYPMREEQKEVIQKSMDRLEHLGIIQKD